MSKFIPNKEHSRIGLIFVVISRKLLLNHTDYCEKLMVNMLHHKIHVNDDFGISKEVASKTAKKFEDMELLALLE